MEKKFVVFASAGTSAAELSEFIKQIPDNVLAAHGTDRNSLEVRAWSSQYIYAGEIAEQTFADAMAAAAESFDQFGCELKDLNMTLRQLSESKNYKNTGSKYIPQRSKKG